MAVNSSHPSRSKNICNEDMLFPGLEKMKAMEEVGVSTLQNPKEVEGNADDNGAQRCEKKRSREEINWIRSWTFVP